MRDEPVGPAEPAEEFEAVWAVVRRLEARIRRLETAVASLERELALLRTGVSDDNPVAAVAADQANEPAISPGEIDSAEPPRPVPGAEPPGVEPYRLVFDGGSLGNPGRGYGSYHITSPRGRTIKERLDFAEHGTAVTSNQAEYLTLIRALERLHDVLGAGARTAHVEILGDSQLVVNQLAGRWKVRNADLQPLHERARSLLTGFGRTDVRWHDRSHSVRLLGH